MAKASSRAWKSSRPRSGSAWTRTMAPGIGRRHLLDLDAALGRAHQQDPAGGPIEHRRQVELLDDVGGRRDQDLADRDALDVHAQDGAGDQLGLLGEPGQLDAAGLASAADQHLGLDHDLLGTRPRRTARPTAATSSAVWATSQAGTGRPCASKSDLASASWIFTSCVAPIRGAGRGRAGTGNASPAAAGLGAGGDVVEVPGRASASRPRRPGAWLEWPHGPPRDPDPRRRHRAGAGGGDLSRPRRDGRRASSGRRSRRARRSSPSTARRCRTTSSSPSGGPRSRSRARSRRRSGRASGAST